MITNSEVNLYFLKGEKMGIKLSHAAALIRGYAKNLTSVFSAERLKKGRMLRIYKDAEIRLRKNGKIKIGDRVSVKNRSLISALNGAYIEIGNGCGISSDCKIVSHEKIVIGDNTILAPGVIVYDHDHKFGTNGVNKHDFVKSHIEIGRNCWIGAYTVILRGSKIGDNCVIGAHSVVKGEVPAGSVFIQKKEATIRKIDESIK